VTWLLQPATRQSVLPANSPIAVTVMRGCEAVPPDTKQPVFEKQVLRAVFAPREKLRRKLRNNGLHNLYDGVIKSRRTRRMNM
jgi:hypothetical protein